MDPIASYGIYVFAFLHFGNAMDKHVSIAFTSYGNMTAIRDNVRKETLRKYEFK